MQLLLVRHGNTFEEGTPSVWIGEKSDLALTQKGVDQAEALGRRLAQFRISVAAIYSGPQLRQRQHAAVIAKALGHEQTSIITDKRLREIDYGSWEGKTDAEIATAGHEDDLKAWNDLAAWPREGNWAEDEKSVESRVDSFLASAEHAAGENITLVAVTSGGVLRCINRLISSRRPTLGSDSTKVATGNASSIYLGGISWQILFWNVHPDEIPI